jgi:carbon starvation protein
LNIFNNYLPQHNYLLAFLGLIIMILMVIVFAGAFKRWAILLKIQEKKIDSYGDRVLALTEE